MKRRRLSKPERQQRYVYGSCYRSETWEEYCKRKGLIIRTAKGRIRTLEQEEKNALSWNREFDYICGGSERK